MEQTGRVTVDGWLEMNAPAQTAVLFKELRVALNAVLQERIWKPQVPIHSHKVLGWSQVVLMCDIRHLSRHSNSSLNCCYREAFPRWPRSSFHP